MGVVKSNSKLGRAIKAVLEKPATSKAKKINLKSSKITSSKTVKPSPRLAGLEAVVINLKSRADRWLGLQKTAKKNAPWLKFQRLDAVDGHLRAWQMCASSNKPLIVLEDDAVILPTFTATLNKALDDWHWNKALWQASNDRGSRKRVGDVLMEPTYLWTTVGYIIWPAAANAFMKLLPADMPVDNFMAWHIKEQAVKEFSVQPACVRQANTWNVGSDVLHSGDVALWNIPSPSRSRQSPV